MSFLLSLVHLRAFIAGLAFGEVLFKQHAEFGKGAFLSLYHGVLADAQDAANLVTGADRGCEWVAVNQVPPPIFFHPLCSMNRVGSVNAVRTGYFVRGFQRSM